MNPSVPQSSPEPKPRKRDPCIRQLLEQRPDFRRAALPPNDGARTTGPIGQRVLPASVRRERTDKVERRISGKDEKDCVKALSSIVMMSTASAA